MSFLFDGFIAVTWQQTVMYGIGLLLIYLAICKNYEPSLLLPMGLGLVAFIFDTVAGVLFAKFMNLFTKNKINPMVGAARIWYRHLK